MADFVDLAYAAGIMDGEGYIGITVLETTKDRPNSSPSFNAVVNVGMADPEVVMWLRDMFGGNVYSYGPRGSSKRGVHHWRLTGARAAEFCQAIQPYLRIKQRQAALLVQYRNDPRINHQRHGGRGGKLPEDEVALRREYKTSMQALNQREAVGT